MGGGSRLVEVSTQLLPLQVEVFYQTITREGKKFSTKILPQK